MSKQFIQIGRDIFNCSSIIRIAIEKDWNGTRGYSIYTKEMNFGPEGEGGCYTWSSRVYPFGSEEAKALAAWLESQVEVLTPFREEED